MKKILREIGMIARCITTINDIEFKEINLTKGQHLYLVRIYENPGIIQERVADMLKVDRTTAAKSIKKLVEKGLVEKRKDENNKKKLKLYCTEKGDQVYPFILNEEVYAVQTALKGINDEEKEILFKLLYKMRTNVEKDWKDIKKGKRRNN